MKKYIQNLLLLLIIIGLLSSIVISCDESVLDETPLSFISPENAYTSKDAFMNGITGLHYFARLEQYPSLMNGEVLFYEMSTGTDVATPGERYTRGPERFRDYTLITPYYAGSEQYWNWAYGSMISNANVIIARAESADIGWSDEDKNAIIAEAKFFRAYTYNILVNIFGGVPLVIEETQSVKLDYIRASRLEILQQAQEDLEFAAEWLPTIDNLDADGRIPQGAANHLLTEVYISLGRESGDDTYYDKAVAAATKVISSGKYQLMTDRFGDNKDLPGDVFRDLFWDYNINRSTGNTETIWALQYECNVTGDGHPASNWMRGWGPRIWDLKDPDGNSGMQVADSTGRPVGYLRATSLVFYDVWNFDPDDMRNAKYNMKRDFWWNNPASAYFGQKVEMTADMDTIWKIYPIIGKLYGDFTAFGATSGYTPKDIYKMRLAETYLLRGEAYMWKGDLENAANDINVVRARANAKLASASDIDIDFILDERVRELVVEEARKRTLVRTGKFYERTLKYNWLSSATVQEYNTLWPIPQSAIDANLGAVLEQNPGY